MDFMDLMRMKNFVVLGSTSNKEKKAYEIKEALLNHGKNVFCVREEYPNISSIDKEIDVIDICMNPKFTLEYLTDDIKAKGAIIQPGAESDEVHKRLKELNIPYFDACALVGCIRLDSENN